MTLFAHSFIHSFTMYHETRDLFKKIRDIKGIFHAKMGLIKDRNGMDLTEAEDIKKRWKEYTKELQKRASRLRESWWCDH